MRDDDVVIEHEMSLEWLQTWLRLRGTKLHLTHIEWTNLRQPITDTSWIRKKIMIAIQSHLPHLSASRTMLITHVYFDTPEIGRVFYKLRSMSAVVVFLPTVDEYYEIELARLF